MASINPTVSLQSSNSNMSSCSDSSVDVITETRSYSEGCSTDSSLEDSSYKCTQHLNGCNTATLQNGDNIDVELGDHSLERVGPFLHQGTRTSPYSNETDTHFWIPPGPEYAGDDMECGVSNKDDDEECGDGSTWGKSTSLVSLEDEGNAIQKQKEEKQKAMEEVMNGRFKTLVDQLLKSVGVVSLGKDSDNWVDIVTSLSWEAATFVKPDAAEGKTMDPDGYVKIKCIATGSPGQSRVIKGVVFKKHAAHKHMPTKCKNPRLLLIQGALGLSTRGLSSFESMQQEKDSKKAITDVIELYQPNLVLVEKTVSRDIQESILSKGITLVLDVKLHRLERVARCTGSPILSSDILVGQELRQCDSFYFEKFVEDYASPVEGGRRPSKTLMFLEGCPTRLGCSILLMGTNSDQLKRIKCAVRCAVVMAYRLILETYFLLDQRAMFSSIPLSPAVDRKTLEFSSIGAGNATSCNGDLGTESDAAYMIDIPILNGYHEEGSQYVRPELVADSSFSFETHNQAIFSSISSFSASFKALMEESAPLFANSGRTLSSYLSFNEKNQDGQGQTDAQVDQYETETKRSMDEEKENGNSPQDIPSTSILAHQDTQSTNGEYEEHRDDIKAMLDSESILVLMSCRNSARGIMCDHSHFSHIKFYRNFDVPLGKFLQDNLLNQKLQCKTCGESPEAHLYYYAHHRKQLVIQVRHLPGEKSLHGETEGKLWMWSRCGKCKLNNGSFKSTKRVLISTAARGLSFGKFLELSFSNPSSFSTISNCGHSLHKDFLYFFGLGPMVAMFKYAKVATYSVALPPQKLEFGNSVREDFLKKEFENVNTKGISMFLDIEKYLEEVRPRFLGMSLNIQGSKQDFSWVKEMLKQEKCQFEVDIQSAVKNENGDECGSKYLRLNKVRLNLLLESFVWDRRLHYLNSSDLLASDAGVIANGVSRESHTSIGQLEGDVKYIAIEDGENADPTVDHKLVTPEEANDFQMKDIPIEGLRDGTLTSSVAEDVTGPIREKVASAPNTTSGQHDSVPSFGQVQSNQMYPVTTNAGGSALDLNNSWGSKSQFRLPLNSGNDEFSIWAPFLEIQQEFLKDLCRGYMPKFESIGLSPDTAAYNLICEEGSRLHIPLGGGDLILSDYEDEFSSIIACALALIKDQPVQNQDLEDESRKEKWVDIKTYGHSQVLPRFLSLNSSHLSSTASLDFDGNHSPPRTYSEELHIPSLSNLDLTESGVSGGSVHYEISMGVGKSSGKRKYSVVCLCASQFRQLRSRWCSSEVDYIASLSRCRNWDAKGGKSKSFFAKTLDDRYIIKEIKRTEFASFMKFAANYFEYMYQCYENGNQTCLAKILGIYQIIIRQPKNGKEIKHDVMVMENLSYGRNISRQYDLKGALHARFTSTGNGATGDVLLDQNFVNDMNVSPLYVGRRSKRNLQRAVWNDCTFLNTINVMDYSLLVGVDEQKRELVCGIIDYLRQYTWDKQLESWVKSSLVVPKNQKPTVISPIDYKKRFRKFIDMHFLSIPDNWCSQRSKPCRLCDMGDEGDEHHRDQEEDGGSCSGSGSSRSGGVGLQLLKSREQEQQQNHNHNHKHNHDGDDDEEGDGS